MSMYIKIDTEELMEFQSDLRPLVKAIRSKIEELDWLISYHEFMYLDRLGVVKPLDPLDDLIWISGIDFYKIVSTRQIQFVWGVISGKRNMPKIDELEMDKLQLKNDDPTCFVLEDAELEIDCFDSGLTTVRSNDITILKRLSELFEKEINDTQQNLKTP